MEVQFRKGLEKDYPEISSPTLRWQDKKRLVMELLGVDLVKGIWNY